MMRWNAILILCLFATGCATLVTRSGLSRIDNPEQTPPYYPATFLDGEAIASRYFVFGLLDLPFSVVFDTLLLPCDCFVEYGKRKTESNHTSDGIRQPEAGLPQPSR